MNASNQSLLRQLENELREQCKMMALKHWGRWKLNDDFDALGISVKWCVLKE